MRANYNRLFFPSAAITLLLTTGCQGIDQWAAAGDGSDKVAITANHYALAEKWFKPNISKLVKNLTVKPHWIGDSDQFWYQRQTATGFEFTVVDAADGTKMPAFDHGGIALALEKSGLEGIKANKLPFAQFEFGADRSTITFEVEETEYSCTIPAATCSGAAVAPIHAGTLVSPDKTKGLLTRGGNLYLVNLDSNGETALTSDGEEHFGYGLYYGNWKASYIPRKRNGGDANYPPMEAKWADNSRHVLVTRLDERHVAPYPLLETAPNDGSFRPKVHLPRIPLTGEPPAKVDWLVIDTQTGSKVRLNLPYQKLFQVHQDMLAIRKHWWSEDYSRLYVLAWGRLIHSAHFYEVDVKTGNAREVIAESMSPRMDTNSTSYSPPNVFSINNHQQVIWFSQRDGWGHLYRYDMTSGKLINQVTRGNWLVRDVIKIDETRQRIFFTAGNMQGGNPYFRYLYRVNFDGSDLTLLTPEVADHMLESPNNDVLSLSGNTGTQPLSPSGNFVAYDYSTAEQPTKSAIRRVNTGELVAIFEESDPKALFATGWRPPEPFVVKAKDGKTDLYGVLYKPHKLEKKQALPHS